MFRQRPDLIVPIRDRRQHKRYLTLKNFVVFVAVSLGAFVAVSLRSELRGLRPGEYGRLVNRELPTVEPKPMEVVTEAPAAVTESQADPMLLEPAARAQWLEDDPQTVTTAQAPVTAAAMPRGDGDVAIVGGPDGVTIARKERAKPVLSGGFGRQ